MLVLCSNGLSSDMLLAQLSSKMADCKTAALVVTADNEYKENNYHVPRCVAELQSLNLNVNIFDGWFNNFTTAIEKGIISKMNK